MSILGTILIIATISSAVDGDGVHGGIGASGFGGMGGTGVQYGPGGRWGCDPLAFVAQKGAEYELARNLFFNKFQQGPVFGSGEDPAAAGPTPAMAPLESDIGRWWSGYYYYTPRLG